MVPATARIGWRVGPRLVWWPAMQRSDLAGLIDHTVLAPGAHAQDIDAACEEALTHGFCTVCVASSWVAQASATLRRLRESPTLASVKVCSVVGFPHGNATTAAKVAETRAAVAAGAGEIDVVMHQGLEDWSEIQADLAAVVDAAEERAVKVILETFGRPEAFVRRASAVSVAAGAAFVKTSTGFGSGGATLDAVRWMRDEVGPAVGVKASGGIRDAATADAMVKAGANRLGCSAGVAIVSGGAAGKGY